MNVLVIGLGSMGKRRIALMKKIYPDFCICGVDERKDRRNEVMNTYGIPCVKTIEAAKEMYQIDVAFVCTSPLSHSMIITECLQNKWNVFTELNLVSDGYEKNISLAKENKCILFLSSTFFYREEIKYLCEQIHSDTQWNYIYHIGQYLSDWHPWENYKDFFVENIRTNGCREIMAIELPWLIKAFGKIQSYHVLSNKMTSLSIEYNDNYLIQFTHINGSKGILVVDVVSPVAVRKLEIYKENKYIKWEGTPDSLFEYVHNTKKMQSVKLKEVTEHRKEYQAFVVENAYKNELNEFFEVLLKGKKPQYSFEQDLEILKLIDQLENFSK